MSTKLRVNNTPYIPEKSTPVLNYHSGVIFIPAPIFCFEDHLNLATIMVSDLTIMLVDNDETDILIASKIILLSGLCKQTIEFTSARQALEYLENEGTDTARLPDLIFLDMNMPLLNGARFLEELDILAPRLSKNPKVVVLSAYSRSAGTEKSLETSRVIRFMGKPLNQSALLDVLKDFSEISLKVA